SRWASSDTNLGGPAKIQRRLSRKNAIRNGESRYQTTKILKIIRTFKLLQIYRRGLTVSSLGRRLQAMRNLRTRLASGRSEIFRTRPRLWRGRICGADRAIRLSTPATFEPSGASAFYARRAAPPDRTNVRRRFQSACCGPIECARFEGRF